MTTASHHDRVQKLRGESTPEQTQSLLDEIGDDIKGFLRALAGMLTGQKPLFKKIDSDRRHTWKNDTRNQVVQPLQYLTPDRLSELVEIVQKAEATGCKVRAVGSGHSFSDVVQTTDFLINTDKLNKPIDLDTSLLKSGVDTSMLVHVENGIKIRQLNAYLDSRGLALPNMGGYDAQSIVGAASTSTHGSGISLGPISSIYKSIVLVADGGQKYRIEPTDGITDPVKYKANFPANRLVQDDEWFNTVSVSMGCTGIIYSVILQVMPKYWLKEVRTMSDWETVKSQLLEGRVLNENRHYEVLVNPYPVRGKHPCLVTIRNITDEPTGPRSDKHERNFLTQLIGLIPGMVYILDFIFDTFPMLSPLIINEAMKGLVDDSYIDVSYRVLNLGTANNISAYSSEIGFPVEGHAYIRAVERIFKVAARMKSAGMVYHTSPISLRFVKASDAYLSMMHGRDTCMIEMPVVNGTYGGFELLHEQEAALYEIAGRPHWGQVNHLTGSNDLIRQMYPALDKWLNVYRQLNAKGTFNNQFTDRCGFSPINYRNG